MNGRKSRLRRKAERVFRSEVERDTDQRLGNLRRDRDAALRAINVEFDKQYRDLIADRNDERKKVWEKYDHDRATVLKAGASKEFKLA